MQAILGKKIGMTQFISKEGALISATALEAGPCVVTDLKNPEKHGYKAAQIGYGGNVKEKNVTRAMQTFFKKKNLPLKKWLREVRLSPEENLTVGQEIKADVFKPGDLVDVQGKSIGKGFAGGMKKWHWRGGPGGHGSMFHRRIGSAGASSFPSRTWPGHHMPGRMGNATTTIQNLEVLKVDVSKNLLLLKGSVPGGDQALLYIRRSLKNPAGIKPKVAPKLKEKKDPLKASKQAAAGKKK
ncbi:MAG: 50S ribosomal protein L3 [Candidatus Omnitrophica bacterium]|nr:50S ribosomal protein L3 [Candidatus Omnitrophota bacterium]